MGCGGGGGARRAGQPAGRSRQCARQLGAGGARLAGESEAVYREDFTIVAAVRARQPAVRAAAGSWRAWLGAGGFGGRQGGADR